MIFEYQDAPAVYPHLTSDGLVQANGGPVGWGALSGLAAGEDGMIYAVSDSVYGLQPSIFVIDPGPGRLGTATFRISTLGDVTRYDIGRLMAAIETVFKR